MTEVTTATADRVYLQWREGLAWHGVDDATGYALCGAIRPLNRRPTVDRVPSTGHFCNRCARSIAARTDVEA